MSASQDASQKFHQYDSDDRQLLVGLLHEYSDKLVEASRKVARNRTDEEELNRVLWFGIALCTILSYWLLQLFINYAKSNELQTPLYISLYVTVHDNLFLTIAFTSLSLFMILGMFVLKSKSFSSSFEKKSHRERC